MFNLLQTLKNLIAPKEPKYKYLVARSVDFPDEWTLFTDNAGGSIRVAALFTEYVTATEVIDGSPQTIVNLYYVSGNGRSSASRSCYAGAAAEAVLKAIDAVGSSDRPPRSDKDPTEAKNCPLVMHTEIGDAVLSC